MKFRSFVNAICVNLLATLILVAATFSTVHSQEPNPSTPADDSLSNSFHISSDETELSAGEISKSESLEKRSDATEQSASKNPFARSIRDPKTSSPPSQTASDSGWHFAFAPYLYMTGLTGTVGARGRTAEVDLDFTDVIEHLNLGLMGALEARKGRLVLTNDLMWIKLGEERDTPGQLYSSIKVGVNMVVIEPDIGYRVYDGDRGSFDIMGGVRVMSVETNVNFRAGILPADDVSERKTWATPVFGGKGVFNVTPKFFLSTKFDVGGGVGADFTGQFYGGGGYNLTRRIALVGGYRYLRTKYDSDAGFLFDTTMSGILIGAKFSF